MAQIISGILSGTIIAFIFGWLIALLILLVVPVLIIALTIQTKLVVSTGGTGKKAYEKCGSVSIQCLLGLCINTMLI